MQSLIDIIHYIQVNVSFPTLYFEIYICAFILNAFTVRYYLLLSPVVVTATEVNLGAGVGDTVVAVIKRK